MIPEDYDEITGLPKEQALKEFNDATPKPVDFTDTPLVTGTAGEMHWHIIPGRKKPWSDPLVMYSKGKVFTLKVKDMDIWDPHTYVFEATVRPHFKPGKKLRNPNRKLRPKHLANFIR